MNPKPKTPSIEKLFEKTLSVHILTSRWGRYIGIGSVGLRPSDFIRYNETLVHHDPTNNNFWELYRQAKGIFKTLGFSVKQTTRDGYPLWIVNVPIVALTDTVFVDSGLVDIGAWRSCVPLFSDDLPHNNSKPILLRLTGAKGWMLTGQLMLDLYHNSFDYFEVAFVKELSLLRGNGYDPERETDDSE